MKDILVLVTLQPLLRAIQKYIWKRTEPRRYPVLQEPERHHRLIDKKLPSSVEVIISTPGPSFFIAQLNQEENTYSSAGI